MGVSGVGPKAANHHLLLNLPLRVLRDKRRGKASWGLFTPIEFKPRICKALKFEASGIIVVLVSQELQVGHLCIFRGPYFPLVRLCCLSPPPIPPNPSSPLTPFLLLLHMKYELVFLLYLNVIKPQSPFFLHAIHYIGVLLFNSFVDWLLFLLTVEVIQ